MSEDFSFQNLESQSEEAQLDADSQHAHAFVEESMAGEAHAQVTRFLETRLQDDPVSAFSLEALSGAGNVAGAGVGTTVPDSKYWVADPGVTGLRVYLIEPMDEVQVRRILHEEMQVEAALDPDLPVQPVVTGEIEALSHRFRHRPACGGLSVGHVAVSAGTLGCLARGRDGDRRERTLVLSNNHVLANTNRGTFGDEIVQQGRADGGVPGADQIAALERFVPIRFPPHTVANEEDCATAWADPELVDQHIGYLNHGVLKHFSLVPGPVNAFTGLRVGKSGRTTQLTSGQVMNVRATIRVRYGAQVALFENQIEIQGTQGPFGAPGDSGSLIWTLEERNPVGLLFAGGTTSIFANPIDKVLSALDIDILY